MNEPIVDLLSGTMKVDGSTARDCHNPNPYPIIVNPRAEGIVYLKSQPNGTLKRIGTGRVNTVTYPSGGEGRSEGAMEISLPTPEMPFMEAMLLIQSGADLEIVSTMNLTTTAQPVFYGMQQGGSKDGDGVCGFSVRDIMNATGRRKLSPAKCAATVADLTIPTPDDEPKTTHINISEKARKDGENAKNWFVGLIMAFSGTGGLAMTILGVWRCRVLSTRTRDVKGNMGGGGDI